MCDISHGNRIIINCRTRIAERDQCRNEAILRAEPIVDLMGTDRSFIKCRSSKQ